MDSSYDSEENGALFVKIGARVLYSWLYMSFGFISSSAGPGRLPGIAGNAGNHGNDGKFHESQI